VASKSDEAEALRLGWTTHSMTSHSTFVFLHSIVFGYFSVFFRFQTAYDGWTAMRRERMTDTLFSLFPFQVSDSAGQIYSKQLIGGRGIVQGYQAAIRVHGWLGQVPYHLHSGKMEIGQG